jgi:S-adenosylmethionine:tRNA ribosyltransferase-isomerase
MKEKEARKKYQTIFAKITGSAAAPTASLQFTKIILKELENKEIKTAFINLEVGWGTFAPVKTKNIEDHKIHQERVLIGKETADFLNQEKKQGKKILAVGTTVARALESATDKNGVLHEFNNETSLYIYPPYQFQFVDALLTNFHLPKSSLLFLVSAFASKKNIFKAYKEAIKKKYRFFSFGDCMLIKKSRA